MFARILLTLWFVLTLGVVAPAQNIRNPIRGKPGMQQQAPGRQEMSVEGTIGGMAMGRIQVATKTNQTVLVLVQPNVTEVHLTGTATADFLRPGLCVEFTGELAKTGVVKEPLAGLTIVTPGPQKQAGLYPEGAGGGGDAGPLPGVGGEFGAPAAAAGGRSSRKGPPKGGVAGDAIPGTGVGTGASGRKTGAAGGVQLPGVCLVRGQIKTCHGSSLALSAGRLLVKAELAANAEIKLDLADYTMAAKGDKISVKGIVIPGKGILQAESVTIESAQPLDSAKKRPTKPERSAKPDRTTKPVGKPGPAENLPGLEP